MISDTFKVETSQGQSRLLKDLEVWDLLNLPVEAILEIPERLYKEYGISSTFLEDVMKEYIIQSISKDTLMSRWGITEQPVMFVPGTKHYSWPKGAGEFKLNSYSMSSITNKGMKPLLA